MKIVVLDGFTLNPGDLTWDSLENFGECHIYERSTRNEVLQRAIDAEIVITNKVVLDKGILDQLPNLKYIGVSATGYNIVDIKAAKEKGVTVTNVPGYGSSAVAQHTFALILALSNRLTENAQSVNKGKWSKNKDWCFWDFPIMELSGKTIGIVGFGEIGRQVAKIAQGFGMKVISFHKHPERDKMPGVIFVDLETLFSDSDVISLHCPLTEENKGFIDEALLGKMKKSAFLINTSRGPLINEKDLALCLTHKKITGAGLDVLSEEPPQANHPLIGLENCIVTPHNAWAAKESRQRLMNILVNNIEKYMDGSPVNVI
ncbi:D-2-hydroxyacid dehydrogenase [Flexithrix dorotheae]|uniref:D-2-hydroxyacid dehydrogenase n=1 Tax=Flexithrix dorotheae TaxID=70993 RepID=UPI00037C379A|nr:D-2-hydroxyacid dehydrogenase [Flexithrix dorotheae]